MQKTSNFSIDKDSSGLTKSFDSKLRLSSRTYNGSHRPPPKKKPFSSQAVIGKYSGM